jgi:hypothetical protein
MNKKIVIIQFLLFLSYRVYPFEYKNNLSLGVLGIGFFPENGSAGSYFFGNVINFTYQSTSGFGIKISPLHFSPTHEGKVSLTFINTSFFYNFFRDEHFILGPFSSINAVRHNRPGFFELHAGLTFSIRNINFWDPDFYKDRIIGLDFLIVEAGYTYNKDRQGFYATIGMDLLTSLYTFAASQRKEDIDKYQKEHPTY